jgi:hypothetical protein
MRIRTAVVVSLALALALVGCTSLSLPEEPQAEAPRSNPTTWTASEPYSGIDKLSVEQYLQQPGSASEVQYTIRQLADLSSASIAFSGALFPSATLGRRLVGVVHWETSSTAAPTPERLFLVYEGGMTVMQTRSVDEQAPSATVEPATEATTVGGDVKARAWTEPGLDVNSRAALVEWHAPYLVYQIYAPGAKVWDAVGMARSMAPLKK